MSEFNLTRIDRLRYKPSKAAEAFLAGLRTGIFATDKATLARLAIARSLREPGSREIALLPSDTEMGNAIEGVHLFGEDHDLWACLICVSVPSVVDEPQAFRALVEAHWHRGAMLLRDDLADAHGSDVDFILRLASMAPSSGALSVSPATFPDAPMARGPITVRFGSVSEDFQTGEQVVFTLNAPGTSPHLAIMGKTRSGKSRTGLEIASQVITQADLPLILIDPKGEFVKDGRLISKPEWGGQTLEKYFPGIQAIDVPRTPIPLDFLWRPTDSDETTRAQLAMSFRDSFQKCLRARGDVALNLLRETVQELLRHHPRPISFREVLQAYEEASESAGKSAGSIGAKLSEIEALGIFRPEAAPPEFFTRRWVISFGGCSDEPKRLAIFLLFDALNTYFMSLADSALNDGHRALRHMLIVDEAREVLSYRHGALSSLIRKSASKGGVTMLLSQGSDDFDQEEDDFLEQMGTIGVFALSSASTKSLVGAFGRRLKIEDLSDRSLPSGTALVKLPGLAPKKVIAWR